MLHTSNGSILNSTNIDFVQNLKEYHVHVVYEMLKIKG
jgi:hypothetical protein